MHFNYFKYRYNGCEQSVLVKKTSKRYQNCLWHTVQYLTLSIYKFKFRLKDIIQIRKKDEYTMYTGAFTALTYFYYVVNLIKFWDHM